MDDINERIERMKREAAALSGGRMVSGTSPDCPPEIEEKFWRNVLAFESVPEVAPLDELTKAGVAVPAASDLDDAALSIKLWEIVRGLFDLGVCLEFTDHLSDRELYERLSSRVLREPMALTPDDHDSFWHVDMSAGDENDDGMDAYLMYYADDDTRREWAERYPDNPMPEHRSLRFDRDRYLASPWEANPWVRGDNPR
jgi:hypothetical protein